MFPGDEILLKIEKIALSGEGIARKDGVVVFVEGALPGEEVRAAVTKSASNLIKAKAIEILTKSPARTEPKCPHFGVCGGCSFQHLNYPDQLKEKHKALQDLFAHMGGFKDVQVENVNPSPKPYGYRNTIALSVRDRKDDVYFGFIGKDNRTFIPIENCPIAGDKINSDIASLKTKFKENIPEEKRKRISQVMIRQGMNGEIYSSFQSPEKDQVLTAQVFGKTFRFSGPSFFQINYSILEDFVGTVKKFLEPDPKKELLDLYCGVGLFALCLADSYQNVLGIEEGESAISFARENASANGISNAHFISGRTEETLSRANEFLNHVTHVVLDPPRIGMKKEAVEMLLTMKEIEKIVYVSCDPATLIRDLKLLSSEFQIKSIRPFDMFPQTAHLETIVLLTRI